MSQLIYGTANIKDNIALNSNICRMKVTGKYMEESYHLLEAVSRTERGKPQTYELQ
jgi:hypothetical protein